MIDEFLDFYSRIYLELNGVQIVSIDSQFKKKIPQSEIIFRCC